MGEQHRPSQPHEKQMRNRPRPGTIVAMEATGAGSGVTHWTSAAFHHEASAWVREVCAPHGIELTGTPEQPHCRPWSSALRFDSTAGPLWFKVNGPGTRHEPRLLDVLARLVPDLVAEVLATDTGRGWSLTRDAGPVMRTTAEPEQLWSSWEGVLQRYAAAQIRLSAYLPELLATGTPELTPVTLPGRAAALVKQLTGPAEDEGGLSPEQAEALNARLPEYDAWCAELAASGIPGSIQHDDLHSSNICWGGSVASARVIDWGDASVGHPLGTMLCTLNSVAHHAGLDIDDAEVRRLRDAYLEPFTAYAGRVDLVRYVGLARRVGCVTRALSYQLAFEGEPVRTQAEFEFPVREWFLELLED
jgi:hypothetical protein